jgi:zinc transport system substrate-binding protein
MKKQKNTNKLISILLLLFLSCSSLYAQKLNIIVSIAPQKAFLYEIAKEKVNITQMVKTGSSPHTYEPKPSQMRDISKADIYMSIAVEFESVWLDRFHTQNKNMLIIDTSKDIVKQNINHNHPINKNSIHKDPHIWTTPSNIKIIASNILNTLVKYDKPNQAYYQANYDKFIAKLDRTDNEIKNILKNCKNSKFMVFHPSWGYFAKEYNLIQIPIEIEGKKPKPREIISLIKEAKKENIKAIIVAPEFPKTIATNLANELNIEVVSISPLNPNYSQNLINLSKAIANK